MVYENAAECIQNSLLKLALNIIYWSRSKAGLYPSTFVDPRFRNEDSVFVMHECSSGGQEGKSPKDFIISDLRRLKFCGRFSLNFSILSFYSTLLRNLTAKLL